MTTSAWLLMAVGFVFALTDWIAVLQRRKPIEYIAKPATLVAFIGAALALDPLLPGRRGWFVAALVLSLVGDVFLMLPADLFVPGLGSFLLAHVAYIVGLRVGGGTLAAVALWLIPVLILTVVLGRHILRGARADDPKLAAPVTAYVAVISVMVVCALADGNPLTIVGALLFYSSDALIAGNRFVRPLAAAPVLIIVTYHLAQAGFVLSLARGS